jgi:Fe-S cluster biosynthesis and repair protein YggX
MTEEMIEQYRKMAKANPDDDLAHFALGQALLDAERYAEAAPVLRHVTRINPNYTRAYLLLGRALEHNGDEEGAIEAWQVCHQAASRRGELMSANEAGAHLKRLGAPLTSELSELFAIDEPEPEDDREPGEGEVRCVRSGRVGKRMSFEPFEGELGAYIIAHVSQESWEAWMEMSIKVINELRLDLGEPEGQRVYDEHMRDYLNLPGELFEPQP